MEIEASTTNKRFNRLSMPKDVDDFFAKPSKSFVFPAPTTFEKPEFHASRPLANQQRKMIVKEDGSKIMDTDDSFTKGPVSGIFLHPTPLVLVIKWKLIIAQKWTIGESCALKNALFVYLQTNGIDSSEALNFVASTAKEKNDKYPGNHSQFLVELYRISGLNRSLTQIACHLKVKLEEQNWERAGDKWTPEEDTRLIELAQLYSRSWARIERALGRKGCRERLRQLETHAVGDYETGHFSKQEQLQFLRGLLVHHHPVSEDIIFPEPEVLQKIEADFVPTRSIISLRKKFENGFRLVWIEAKKKGWTGADDEKLTEEDLELVKKAANPGKFTRDLEIVLLRVLQETNAKDESEIIWHQIMLAHPKLSVWQPKQLSYRWYLIKAKALPHLQALGKFQDCIVYLLELFRAKRVSIGGDASASAKSIVSAEFIDESDEDVNDEGPNNNEQPAVIAVKPKKVKKNKKKSDMAVAASSQSVIGANNVVPSDSEVIVPAKSVNNLNKDAHNLGRNDNDARVQTTIAMKNVKKNKNETSATILAEATPAATTPPANSPKKKKRKAMLDSQYSESSPKPAEITAAVSAEKPKRKNQSSEMENSTTPTDEPPKKKKKPSNNSVTSHKEVEKANEMNAKSLEEQPSNEKSVQLSEAQIRKKERKKEKKEKRKLEKLTALESGEQTLASMDQNQSKSVVSSGEERISPKRKRVDESTMKSGSPVQPVPTTPVLVQIDSTGLSKKQLKKLRRQEAARSVTLQATPTQTPVHTTGEEPKKKKKKSLV